MEPATPSVPIFDRIRAVSRRPDNLGESRAGSISLAMGEPSDPTPAIIVDAVVKALRDGRTHYAPLAGLPELREAISLWETASCGNAVSPEQVVVTHGGSAGLAASILTLVSPGERVLLPEPTYSLYADHVAMAGGVIDWVPNLTDGSLDLEQIEQKAPGSRLLVLCNPSNPTGSILKHVDFARLANLLGQYPNLLLLSDEAYKNLVFDDVSFVSSLSLKNVLHKVLAVCTFSKTFAMTGFRLGYVVAPPDLAEQISVVHRTINGSLNTSVQDAGVVALRAVSEELERMRCSYQRRRDLMLDALADVSGVTANRPSGAFYAFPRVEKGLSSLDLLEKFRAGGVLVRSGAEFGPSGEGHVRLSFATSEASLVEGLRRFRRVVENI